MLLERDSASAGANRRGAVLAFVAIAGLALLANAARVAESPVSSTVPALAAFGPGKIGKLRAIQMDAQGRIPANAVQLGREALAADPLAYEPFFAAATGGFHKPADAGSAADAALLNEALRRNPRSREARIFLLRHAIATGSLGGAIDQIAALNRLSSSTERLMLGVGQAITTPKLVDEAAQALKPHPELFRPFLQGFSGAKKSREIAVRMIASLPASAMNDPAVRRLAIRELVRAQAFAEARELWGRSVKTTGLVHSPDFADTKGPPPFNWDLVADETGAAERSKEGGLSVDYFGRHPGALASQLLTLAPGSYRAKIVYRTDGGTPGAIGLQLQCVGQEALLLDRPLDAAIGTNQALTAPFTIPAGCAGQMLNLAGRLREDRNPQQALVRSIEVERAAK